MSHLSNIISRVERTIEKEEDPFDDPLMEQHIRNLREYPTLWDDMTEEEMERRAELLKERPWNVETVFTAECEAEDCDWSVERDTKDQIREATEEHYYGDDCAGEVPAPVWDREVIDDGAEE